MVALLCFIWSTTRISFQPCFQTICGFHLIDLAWPALLCIYVTSWMLNQAAVTLLAVSMNLFPDLYLRKGGRGKVKDWQYSCT